MKDIGFGDLNDHNQKSNNLPKAPTEADWQSALQSAMWLNEPEGRSTRELMRLTGWGKTKIQDLLRKLVENGTVVVNYPGRREPDICGRLQCVPTYSFVKELSGESKKRTRK